ncbi:hypothetical protein P7K49_016590 [Saguinus oedipus]|uniref:Uncharacterized protein n=1 Tax=Saguinus oedipus TaxID=9490 RepID=A0ABQ9VD33_SAGOE|nr:hypothetical protein P7K49_016590 [Saguinus oedipus]
MAYKEESYQFQAAFGEKIQKVFENIGFATNLGSNQPAIHGMTPPLIPTTYALLKHLGHCQEPCPGSGLKLGLALAKIFLSGGPSRQLYSGLEGENSSGGCIALYYSSASSQK